MQKYYSMDLRFFKKSLPTLLFLIAFSFVVIPIMYSILKTEDSLKTLNPSDVNPQLVDKEKRHVRRNHKVAAFQLTNQNNETINNSTFKDKIYVADFFFTTCQSICPVMTSNMKTLQDFYEKDDEILFLSHTVTPDIDSVATLRNYADKKGVIDDKWHLTTADKKQIYNLARKSYMVGLLDEGNGDKYDFIHTENFVLVDKKGRIKGIYDGTKKEDIEKIKEDIAILKKSEK